MAILRLHIFLCLYSCAGFLLLFSCRLGVCVCVCAELLENSRVVWCQLAVNVVQVETSFQFLSHPGVDRKYRQRQNEAIYTFSIEIRYTYI